MSDTKLQIIVTPRTVFGRKLYYPVNPAAKALAKIAGSDTLTLEVMRTARDEFKFEITTRHEDDELFSTADTARKVC
jgi:hypothetical protein